MIKVEHRLRLLMAELSHKLGHTVTIADVARATTASPNTISSYVNNKNERISLRVIGLIIGYFRSHGMDIGMDDLFTISERA